MPALPSGSTILVTGSNGYIGCWIVNTLLNRGFSVRAAVRSTEKAQPLREFFNRFVRDGKLSFVVVEDLTKEDAFYEAVVGVDGIVHSASPLATSIKIKDPEDLIGPAVSGTLSVLKAASLPQSTVKRIVYTSSVAAVARPLSQPTGTSAIHLFNENDWSTSPETVAKEGKGADPMTIYRASKTLGEKAAWRFYDENKKRVGWDLVVLNPSFVYGPPLQDAESPEKWGGTQNEWYDAVFGSAPKTKEFLSTGSSWVDVRDVAEAHVLALEKHAAGGERIIISEGRYVWQEWLNIAYSLSAETGRRVQKGYPEISSKDHGSRFGYDTVKAANVLGLSRYRTKEETTKDVAEGLKKGRAQRS